MTTNGSITIYHYNEDSESWSFDYYPYVWINIARKALASKGMTSNDVSTIRIPTSKNISINIGDKIVFGKCVLLNPPKDLCMTVIGFKANLTGGSPHWRVNCE